jgi:hypothetical protein
LLAAGAASGAFRSVDADADAAIISAIAWDAASRLIATKDGARRQEIRDTTFGFIWRALGAAPLD